MEKARHLYATQEVTEHGMACQCDSCKRAAQYADDDEVRREENCQLAGYSAQVRHWAGLYGTQIAQGYLDPTDYDIRYLQVATIGDSVVNRTKADRLSRQDD